VLKEKIFIKYPGNVDHMVRVTSVLFLSTILPKIQKLFSGKGR
jgi:hypothetical protein